MKAILLAYVFIGLLLIALLSLLSYGYGPGYVYLLWRDWQIQSNLWVLFFTLALLSLFLQLCWLALKRYLTRKQRETALLHKHSKAEFSPIHSNLRHNLGARST